MSITGPSRLEGCIEGLVSQIDKFGFVVVALRHLAFVEVDNTVSYQVSLFDLQFVAACAEVGHRCSIRRARSTADLHRGHSPTRGHSLLHCPVLVRVVEQIRYK